MKTYTFFEVGTNYLCYYKLADIEILDWSEKFLDSLGMYGMFFLLGTEFWFDAEAEASMGILRYSYILIIYWYMDF